MITLAAFFLAGFVIGFTWYRRSRARAAELAQSAFWSKECDRLVDAMFAAALAHDAAELDSLRGQWDVAFRRLALSCGGRAHVLTRRIPFPWKK